MHQTHLGLPFSGLLFPATPSGWKSPPHAGEVWQEAGCDPYVRSDQHRAFGNGGADHEAVDQNIDLIERKWNEHFR